MFPTAGSVPYYNDAGELLGWDLPGDEPWDEYSYDEPDWYDEDGPDEPDMPCGCYSDQGKHTCDEWNGRWLDPSEATA